MGFYFLPTNPFITIIYALITFSICIFLPFTYLNKKYSVLTSNKKILFFSLIPAISLIVRAIMFEVLNRREIVYLVGQLFDAVKNWSVYISAILYPSQLFYAFIFCDETSCSNDQIVLIVISAFITHTIILFAIIKTYSIWKTRKE